MSGIYLRTATNADQARLRSSRFRMEMVAVLRIMKP
jgi:hypothetical protein